MRLVLVNSCTYLKPLTPFTEKFYRTNQGGGIVMFFLSSSLVHQRMPEL